MPHDPKKCLLDVIEACELIQEFTENVCYDEYTANALVSSATERQFEIIGEALNRIKRIDDELLLKISEAERIIAFRNVIAHGYDVVSDKVVWDVIRNKLPILHKECQDLLYL